MAVHYACVRLDVLHPHDGDRLKAWLQTELVDVYVFYHEHGDITEKPHYQGYIKTETAARFKKLKESFKNWFNAHGRCQRAFAHPRKLESYMCYVAKDKDLYCVAGVSDEEIADRESRSFKKQKRSNGDPVDHITVRCMQAFSQHPKYDPKLRDKVATWMVADLADRLKPIETFRVRGWINTVCAKLCGDYQKELVSEILSKY